MDTKCVQIGTIKSIGRSDGLEFTPDDRQQLVKTFNSSGNSTVTVEDYGVVANGEVISFSAVFSATDYSTLLGYWTNRTLVTVVLDDGTTISNARVVVKSVKYYDDLLNQYKTVTLEVWRI